MPRNSFTTYYRKDKNAFIGDVQTNLMTFNRFRIRNPDCRQEVYNRLGCCIVYKEPIGLERLLRREGAVITSLLTCMIRSSGENNMLRQFIIEE